MISDNNEDFKRKREQFVENIRKQKRQQMISKKRNWQDQKGEFLYFGILQNQSKPVLIIDQRYKEQIEMLVNEQYDQNMFDQLGRLIHSADVLDQHRGIIGLRKIIARNVDPPIKQFIDKGLTNKCIQLVKQRQFPQIKLQATWILTNIASGQSKYCERLVERGVIDLFVNLLHQNQKGIIDQAIWGIGNIAADCVKFRDMILKKGGMDALVKVVENAKSGLLIKNGSWAITNLCRGHPSPDYNLIRNSFPLLCKVIKSNVLKTSNSKQVLADLVWAIAYMTQGSKPRIQKANQFQILQQIFKYVQDPYKELNIPALKIIGNFSNGNQNHTEQLVKNGIFDLCYRLLESPKKAIRRQICWILSNIAAGNQSQVHALISNQKLMDKIGNLFHEDNIQVKRQICWIYSNMGYKGDQKTVIQICLHYDVIRIFANLLIQKDSQTLQNVLETLFKLLAIGKKQMVNGKNVILQNFLYNKGGQSLQDLQYHENKKVYELVVKILTKFFDLDDSSVI